MHRLIIRHSRRVLSQHRALSTLSLSEVETQYKSLCDALENPKGSGFKSLNKQLESLQPAMDITHSLKAIDAELKDLESLLEDAEMGEIAKVEIEQLQHNQKEETELLDKAWTKFQRVKLKEESSSELDGKFDSDNLIVEIRAGVGGEEAGIFAKDMFKMYQSFAGSQGWKLEVLSQSAFDNNALREVVFSIAGTDAYTALKSESGVHRVQRVPKTAKDGKIHTSTAAVAILPLPAADLGSDFQLKASDIKMDVFRASGAGGQHVNTTESAVRLTHVPTGVVVAIQDERSQHQNKAKALRILTGRVLQAERERIETEARKLRSDQVGTIGRNQRIRTYNYPQSRITDHRGSGVSSHALEKMMNGDSLSWEQFFDDLDEAIYNPENRDQVQETDD